MYEKLQFFRLAHAMAAHAGTRQAVVAENIANADTPGYKPRDVVPFADLVASDSQGLSTKATRTGHLHGSMSPSAPVIAEREAGGESNPNGNGVSLEEEMLNAVSVKRQHDRALAIYRSGLNILRTSLGRG